MKYMKVIISLHRKGLAIVFFFYLFRQLFCFKYVTINKKEDKLMIYDELERMINNNCTYEEIIEECKRIDEYIKEQIKVMQ